MQKDTIIWKPISGCSGYYEVNNYGEVRSVGRLNKLGNYIHGKVLSCSPNSQGYKHFRAFVDGKKKVLKAHRCVALEFIPNPENKPFVNHKDGNKSNNQISNLEWATASENQKHAYKTGLKSQPKGCKHANSKLTKFDVNEIKRLLKEGVSQQAISEKFDIHQSGVSKIKRNKAYLS